MIAGKVVVILQARMGSRRLPGKALKVIGGATLIEHGITRLQASDIGPVIVATTTEPSDDCLAAEAHRLGAEVFRGQPTDVLSRLVAAAGEANAEFVVRATGDNPAVDTDSPGRLLALLRATAADHAVESGLPVGSTVEVVTWAALRQAAAQAFDPYDREHVTSIMRRPGAGFRCATVTPPASLYRPDLRFTVDTADDLAYMRQVIRHAERKAAGRPSMAQLIASADELAGRMEVA